MLRALYSAGLCQLWLRGGNYLSTCRYWSRPGGLAILDDIQPFYRLKEEYPDHPLANSEWVRENVGDR